LLWLVRLDSYPRPHRPNCYRAPSWSWASVDGRIHFPPKQLTNLIPVGTEILSVSTQTKSGDEMGQIIGGEMMLRGPLMSCLIKKSEDTEELQSRQRIPGKLRMRMNGVWASPSFYPDVQEEFDLGEEFYCLPITMEGKNHLLLPSLILEPTAKGGVFRRCGFMRFSLNDFKIRHGLRYVMNEEWFNGGIADSEGKYTITII